MRRAPRSSKWRKGTLPELPEVETIRRHLQPLLVGKELEGIDVRHPRMLRYQPDGRLPSPAGRRVESVDRKGKYLLIELGPLTWITHLGMSGRIQVANGADPEAPHTHVVASFGEGPEVRLVDPRTFGFIQILDTEQLADSSVARLGPDALGDISDRLEGGLARRKAAIKTVLLDQGFVAGIGNIYADEILHRARIRPQRSAGGLTGPERKHLEGAVRPVLEEGLAWGGTSLEDLAYRLPDGSAGEFVSRLRVYGRETEPCPRCGTPIRRTVISARSSFWCPGCQR